MRLVRVLLALARAAPKHLFKQDTRLHGAEKDDKLQIGYVHAGGHQVYRDDYRRVRPVAELADRLERPVGSARNLADERFPAAENVPRDRNQLVGVSDVRQVVDGEYQRFRETAGVAFMVLCAAFNLFENLAV